MSWVWHYGRLWNYGISSFLDFLIDFDLYFCFYFLKLLMRFCLMCFPIRECVKMWNTFCTFSSAVTKNSDFIFKCARTKRCETTGANMIFNKYAWSVHSDYIATKIQAIATILNSTCHFLSMLNGCNSYKSPSEEQRGKPSPCRPHCCFCLVSLDLSSEIGLSQTLLSRIQGFP